MTALAVVLAAACLAAGVLHLVRLAAVPTDPPDEASHAAMGIGMAAMFSPLGNPVPLVVWTVVFALGGVWFAAVALRTPPGRVRSDAVHHVVGSAAMTIMLFGHGGGVHLSVVAIVLAGYFAWHVLRCADRLRATPIPADGGGTVRVRTLREPRTAVTSHLVLAGAMTVMLVGMA